MVVEVVIHLSSCVIAKRYDYWASSTSSSSTTTTTTIDRWIAGAAEATEESRFGNTASVKRKRMGKKKLREKYDVTFLSRLLFQQHTVAKMAKDNLKLVTLDLITRSSSQHIPVMMLIEVW